MSGDFRITDLLHAQAFAHAVTGPELRETHVSWIILTGPFAYKIKKPVRFDFLDASTLERRAALCAEELRLNQRLAPQIYLDVLPVVRTEGGLCVGGPGEPVEYALRMRQFDPSSGLAELLRIDAVTPEDMRQIARMLADLHQRAPVAGMDTAYGSADALGAQMLGNIEALRALADPVLLPALDMAAARTRDAVERTTATIEARRRAGHVRECHGDLHAGNIVRWQDQWMVFDCLEFDSALRWTDTIGDVSFLFMDLLAHGREDLAHEFLSCYAEQTGDYAGLRLLPLHVACRALVRAKVDLLHALACAPSGQHRLRAAATSKVRLALRILESGPRLLMLMHGLAASGKSTLAGQLVGAARAVRIRSDVERKRLAGAPLQAQRSFGVGEADYTDENLQRTYSHLLACATAALEGGCRVIVDASFLRATHRASFRDLAARLGARFLIVSCHADPAVLHQRLLARAREGQDPSEATPAVLAHQLRTQDPLTDHERQEAVIIETAPDAGTHAIAAVLAAIDAGASQPP